MRLLPRVCIFAVSVAICLALQSLSCLAATPSEGAPAAPESVAAIDPLAKQVDEAIRVSSRRYLNAGTHTPWQIIHGVLALRQDYQLQLGDKKVNAIEWVSDGPSFGGEQWFQKTQFGGRAHPYSYNYAFEGHPNQFLAYMSMSHLPLEHTFKAGNDTITVGDMVRNAQAEVNTAEEQTWTLWALSHYLESDAEWQNRYGEPWSIERLVEIEARRQVQTAACGGTHSLFAISNARNVYFMTGKPLRGAWLEADQKIKRYVQETRYNQNSDGTFSTNYFRGRGFSNDFVTRIGTTGHTLEFLMLALPEPSLKEEWLRRAVAALCTDLIEHRKEPAECGALYHGLDALVIYRERTNPQTTVASDQTSAATDLTGDPDESAELPVDAPRPGPAESH
ncbi:MAG: hypothetical protein WD648_00645 [Planctomycetaceae bacterium]